MWSNFNNPKQINVSAIYADKCSRAKIFNGLELNTLQGSKCPRIKPQLVIFKLLTRGQTGKFNREQSLSCFLEQKQKNEYKKYT